MGLEIIKSTIELYEKGHITKEELRKIVVAFFWNSFALDLGIKDYTVINDQVRDYMPSETRT